MLLACSGESMRGVRAARLYPRSFRWQPGGAVSIQLLSSIRRGAIAAAAGLLLVAGTANAIIFVGDFDPAYGPGIPDLGFRGHSTFDVSAGCLTSPGLHSDN